MVNFLQNLIAGISIGSIYALVGLGFIFMVNGIGIVNMAHGEILMLGGFLAVTFTTMLELPLVLSYILALLGTALFGYILNLAVFKPMINKPLFTVMIATLGLSMVLQCVAGNLWANKGAMELASPVGNGVLNIGGVVIRYQYLLLIATLIVVLIALTFFFNRTVTGKQLRAMSINPGVAKLLGAPTKRLTAVTVVVSCVIAGLTGILMGPIYFVYATMGSLAISKLLCHHPGRLRQDRRRRGGRPCAGRGGDHAGRLCFPHVQGRFRIPCGCVDSADQTSGYPGSDHFPARVIGRV